MAKENKILDFILKNRRNKKLSYDLMSEKHKKVYRALNYFEHFLVFVSAVNGCVSISAVASLVGVPVGITSSAVRIKICAITAGIKDYKSMIKKKKKKAQSYSVLSQF